MRLNFLQYQSDPSAESIFYWRSKDSSDAAFKKYMFSHDSGCCEVVEWVHKPERWVYKMVSLIGSCGRPKPILVDINYSCLTYVIDSGPKPSVTRKGRTNWEEKGDTLKMQSGRTGHAASVRSEAKGCQQEESSLKKLTFCWENEKLKSILAVSGYFAAARDLLYSASGWPPMARSN